MCRGIGIPLGSSKLIFCLPSGEVLGKNSLARSEIEYRIIEYKIQDRSQKNFACGGLIEIVTLDDVKCENHFQNVDLILLTFFVRKFSFKYLHPSSGIITSLEMTNRIHKMSACGGLLVFFFVPCIRFVPLQPVFANFWFGREKIRSLTVDRKSISNCLTGPAVTPNHLIEPPKPETPEISAPVPVQQYKITRLFDFCFN